jgi:hypothetical protein
MPGRTQLRRTVVAVLAVAAAAMAGCEGTDGAAPDASGRDGASRAASGSAEGESDQSRFGNISLDYDADPVIERNQAEWTTPLDRYSPIPAYELENLATDLVRTDCIRDAGFPDEQTGFDYSAPRAETDGPDWNRLFTVELAQKYGYRMAPDPGDNYAADREAGGGDWRAVKSDEYLNVWDRCMDEADTKVDGWKRERQEAEIRALWEQRHPGQPYPATEDEQEAWAEEQMQITEEGVSAAQNDPTNLNMWAVDTSVPRLQEDAAQWRECMAPLGIADLPSEPWDTSARPPQSLQDRWGWDSAGETPSADEIQVATHDARCRQDSGWFDDFYDETWNQEEAFIDQHKAELDASDLAANNEMAEHALQAIRDYLQGVQG